MRQGVLFHTATKTKLVLSFISILLIQWVTFISDTTPGKTLGVNMGKNFVLILPHIPANHRITTNST